MENEPKKRLNFTLTAVNADWLRRICKKSGIPMSLFIDSLITGMRAGIVDSVTDREAASMAFEQISKGLRE